MTKVDPYLHAVLLLHGSGKDVTQESISAVIKASGSEADDAKAKVLAEAVNDVDFEELLKQAVAAPAASPVAAEPAAAEEKKEEEPEEDDAKKEEQAAEGLSSLFG